MISDSCLYDEIFILNTIQSIDHFPKVVLTIFCFPHDEFDDDEHFLLF